MKIFFCTSFVLSMIFASVGTYAQPSNDNPEKVYGLDPQLYNGKVYTYFVPASTQGTPFYNGADFVDGSVTIRGATYNNLLLKYDVFNQQLILHYKTIKGADNQLVCSEAWLETFNLGDTHFEMLSLADTVRQIFQVIGTGSKRVLYSWNKELALDNRFGATNYRFSVLKKKSYLLSGSVILKYNNNRSFVAQFDPAFRDELKKHLRKQKINVKHASDQVITALITYCNTRSLK